MDIAKLVRESVALADSMSDSAQDDITIYPWISDDSDSKPQFGSAVTVSAIVEEKVRKRRTAAGEEILQKALVTIPRPLASNGAANRKEPLDTRDKIVLPSGYTGPILDVNGVIDPSTHKPYMFEVILG